MGCLQWTSHSIRCHNKSGGVVPNRINVPYCRRWLRRDPKGTSTRSQDNPSQLKQVLLWHILFCTNRRLANNGGVMVDLLQITPLCSFTVHYDRLSLILQTSTFFPSNTPFLGNPSSPRGVELPSSHPSYVLVCIRGADDEQGRHAAIYTKHMTNYPSKNLTKRFDTFCFCISWLCNS